MERAAKKEKKADTQIYGPQFSSCPVGSKLETSAKEINSLTQMLSPQKSDKIYFYIFLFVCSVLIFV